MKLLIPVAIVGISIVILAKLMKSPQRKEVMEFPKRCRACRLTPKISRTVGKKFIIRCPKCQKGKEGPLNIKKRIINSWNQAQY